MHTAFRFDIRTLGVAVSAGLLAHSVLGVTINHANGATATNAALSVMAKVGQLRWFFTHASVGGNITTGMNVLHGTDTNRYRLTIYNYDGDNSDGAYHGGVGTEGSEGGEDYRAAADPEIVTNGIVYECMRGNPDWSNKLVCFSNSVAVSGWRFPRVNVVIDKFCWIDPYADPTNYCALISALESQYPETLFVYLTMPLSGLNFDENDERNSFNRHVRSFCSAHNKHLLDVADLEAWNLSGVQQTYLSSGVTNQKMSFDYSLDTGGDWHLNAAGRRRMALGWYSLAAALFAADRDGDGITDGDELLAGTRAADSNSALQIRISPASFSSSSNAVFTWTASSGRYYSVQRATGLVNGVTWSNRLADRLGANSFTDTVEAAVQGFYLLSVRQ
ncbi:MAG TPA: hypothetical protein P5567_01505 [Kiritimatiellia bacterium]|nr:hypothetical protein [Kiritimatiellia bacterium]HRZ11112.1 hypothetical protein [Kiritimatiellia bacterium]HSA19516.1 hypothetical protein [Kiritimatiellia bacterium]